MLEYQPWSWTRLWQSIARPLRYIFWLGVLHILYHYLYVEAFSQNLDIMYRLDPWPLAGIA